MRSAAAIIAFASISCVASSASAARMIDPGTCSNQQVYVPPYFVGVNAGDALLYPVNGTANDPVTKLFTSIGLSYTHAALAWDNSGQSLAETYWDGSHPPSTHDTGGAHECSRLIASGPLQNLRPGTTGTGTYDPNRIYNGVMDYPSMGTPYCNTPPDSYHINSIMHDDVYGGTCEKYLVDYCGVQVQPEDRRAISPDEMNAGLQAVYFFGYNAVTGAYGQYNWFEQDYFSWICGGIDPSIMGQRGGMQVVNEVRWKWWELQMPDGDSTDTLGMDTDAMGVNVTAPGGWQTWEYLGAGSQNTQWTGDPSNPTANTTFGSYCTNVNISNQTPGGSLSGEGASCPSWQNYGNSQPVNVPDNIDNAARRMGITPTATQTGGGYWTWQTVCD